MNGNGGASKFEDVLDRMAMGGGTAAASSSSREPFVASSTWQGSRPGYYFGTGSEGTGYYLDHHGENGVNEGPSKKRKRGVQIAEDKNEMKIVEPVNLLEQAEKKASGSIIVELTPKGLRSATNSLVKVANQNAMQRAESSEDPTQYMDSELALYDHISSLKAIAANANLYKHLVDNEELMSTLIQLLGHENVDVCASVVSLFVEWIDPTLASEADDLLPILALLSKRFVLEAWETCVSNLPRFQEQRQQSGDDDGDEDLKGIDNILSLMENILEIDLLREDGILTDLGMSVAAYMVKETKILSWIFLQIDDRSSDEADDENTAFKERCLEILAFLSQKEDVHGVLKDWSSIPAFQPALIEDTDVPSKKSQKQEPINGIEILLQSIGSFRKRQPSSDTEVEFLENACIVLASCLTFSHSSINSFLEGQGVELAMRCLKERVHAGGTCLKLLDFSGHSVGERKACEHIVKAGGLKYLFPIFMGIRIPRPALFDKMSKKAKKEWLQTVEAHTIRIMFDLTLSLDEESPDDAKARFVAKFLESDDVLDRLVELLILYDDKARKAEFKFYRSDTEDQIGDDDLVEMAALDAKLKGGGDLFHRLGAIAAFVCVHSKRAHERILGQLKMQQSGISLVKAALEEFSSVLNDGFCKDHIENLQSII